MVIQMHEKIQVYSSTTGQGNDCAGSQGTLFAPCAQVLWHEHQQSHQGQEGEPARYKRHHIPVVHHTQRAATPAAEHDYSLL